MMCELLQVCAGGSAPAKSFPTEPKAVLQAPVGDGAGAASPGGAWELFPALAMGSLEGQEFPGAGFGPLDESESSRAWSWCDISTQELRTNTWWGRRGPCWAQHSPGSSPGPHRSLTSPFPSAPGLFSSAPQEATLLPGVAAVPKQGHWISPQTLETLIY